MKRSTTASSRPRRISLRTILYSLAFLLTLFITLTAAQEGDDNDNDTLLPPPTTEDPPPPPPPSPAVSPSPSTTDTLPTLPPATPKPKPEPPVTLPPVLYIPPVPFNVNNDALEPIFPTGSESCQKCKYFYPKLKECNQIAQHTLALLPRLVPSSSNNDTMTLVYPPGGANGTTTAPTTAAPSTFTTLMPFLQCICPNQGLPATKVCLTCFRVSNQRNFLDQLSLQNVSNSLSAFQEACQDSNNGTVVPPAGTKGQSASLASSSLISTFLTSSWMFLLVGVLSISFSSSIVSI
ncbi:MAG: hypothetical protein J3R72DRAFT_437397 [Linnemannia gamsii]|nr:MAG: hypothetical protein J3R72DRAFT_437397 [Linnemannia gamsii]